MNKFSAEYFFDLEEISFREIFDEECVYHTFKKISLFFKEAQLGVLEGVIDDGAYLVDSHLITIKKGAHVEAGAYIKGPCFIDENTVIRHGAYLRGNVIVGKECVIGHATEVKNSILLNGLQAGHFNYIGNSILGKVNLGAGTILANLRLDRQPIFLFDEGKKIDTELHKFGAIIGDFSSLGCNTVTNPGTCIGKHVLTYPVLNLSGFIPSNTVVKQNQRPL